MDKMKNGAGIIIAPLLQYSTIPFRSHIRVAGAEHRREPGSFFLAPAPFARLLKMPMIEHYFQRPFAINLFLEPPQSFLHRFALF